MHQTKGDITAAFEQDFIKRWPNLAELKNNPDAFSIWLNTWLSTHQVQEKDLVEAIAAWL